MADILDVYEGDPLLAPAFVDMVRWAIGEPVSRATFEAETGMTLPPPARTPLDAMIDEATDAVGSYVMEFAAWAYGSMWADAEIDPEEA